MILIVVLIVNVIILIAVLMANVIILMTVLIVGKKNIIINIMILVCKISY